MPRDQEDRQSAGRRRLRRILAILVGAVVVEYLVFPQLAGARKALQLLGRVEPLWLVAGAVLEVAAIVCYAELTRTLIPSADRPSRPTLVRITLSTLGLSHVIPGGAAVGSSMGYRLLTTNGVRGADAGFALAAQSLGSAVVLNILLWLGLVISIPIRGFNPLYATAAVLGALLLTAVGVAVALLTKGEDRLAATVCRVADRVPFVEGAGVADALARVAERLRALGADRRLLARGALWATLNWVFDAASLWLFLAAFGHRVGLDGLVISYGLANVFAAIPLTPGGLGVIETVLTATLVGFGTPRGIALLGVVSWRILNFWLPIPLGAVSYLTLRVGAPEEGDGRTSELRRVAEEAEQAAPRAGQWAWGYGVRLPPAPTVRRHGGSGPRRGR